MRATRNLFETISALTRRGIAYVRHNRFRREDLRHFDWVLFFTVIAISLFGIVCVFSATSSEVTEKPATVMEMLATQSIYYPSFQLLWLILGVGVVAAVCVLPYKVYERYYAAMYVFNIALLVITLLIAEAGRGGMTAFLSIGSTDRGIQPSEIGKSIMIVCMAKVFSTRTRPINSFKDLAVMGAFVGLPVVLVILQPDFGTALVYLAVFAVMTFVSGTDKNLIYIILGIFIVGIVTLFFALSNTSSGDNFRMTRILIWLDPMSYPDEARQVINGQIAVGSGGMFGKGIVSPGSFASLGYISDDHTDFIFAIVCESFGLVGGILLVGAYAVLIARMIYQAIRVKDPMGSYIIIGVVAMYLFHIVENIGMVIGLLPVTGIPLPFVSYGGSNMITNMIAIGLVENVVSRSYGYEAEQKITQKRQPITL